VLQSPIVPWLLRCHSMCPPRHQQASRSGEWRCRQREVRVATAFGEESSAAVDASMRRDGVVVVATTWRGGRCGLGRPDALSGDQMFHRLFSTTPTDTDATLPDESVLSDRVCSGRLEVAEHRSTRIQAPRA